MTAAWLTLRFQQLDLSYGHTDRTERKMLRLQLG
jgi:hypothetical protein